jgi:hypothetical protein
LPFGAGFGAGLAAGFEMGSGFLFLGTKLSSTTSTGGTTTSVIQPPFPSTIGAQLRNAKFLTTKPWSEKTRKMTVKRGPVLG